VQRALAARGHSCSLADPATLLCDRDDPAKPTLVIVYVSRGKMIRLAFTSSFPWKASSNVCAENATKLNELNRANDLLKVVCTDEILTWMAPLIVSQQGVTDEDIGEFASWFSANVQVALHASELVHLLK
jgi:hypothetical protein